MPDDHNDNNSQTPREPKIPGMPGGKKPTRTGWLYFILACALLGYAFFNMGSGFANSSNTVKLATSEMVSAIKQDRVEDLTYTVQDGSVTGHYWKTKKDKGDTSELKSFSSTYVGVIPVGALIQSSSRPQRTFQAVSASIISSANWRKLAIRPIESIAGTFTFDFGVSRNATSGEVGTYAESSSVTKKMTVSSYDDAYSQMLAAVQSFDALVKFGITVSDETDDQGEHSIVLTASGAADSFSATLCKYITVTEVTSNIQFESAEYGSYVLADGVITQIVTTVDGWTACTNDIAPIKGRLTQTDAEARTSYTNRVASRGTGTVASIVSLLYSDVDGVTFAAGYENYNDTTDAAGRPPHSIEIVVQGGSDEDVANIIWKNKAGGIRAYGKHYAYATDINGNRQYLEFTRVNDIYLLLSVTVTSSGGLDDDYAARIKSLLMEEILSAGTTIRLQTFIRPIMESVSGVDYVEIRGLLSEKPDIEGVADNSMLTGIVPVAINQQPVLSMSGIRVVKA